MPKNRLKKALAIILTITLLCSSSAFATIGGSTAKIEKSNAVSKSCEVQSVSTVDEAVSILSGNSKSTQKSKLTTCDADCKVCPTIIIPGVFQSNTILYDDNGNPVCDENGKIINGWPIAIDTNSLIKELAGPLAKTLITQKDGGFTDKVAQTLANVFSLNESGLNAQPINNIKAEKYNKSLAKCTQEEKNFIYGCIPVGEFSKQAGEDHLYFFSYNSFGNNLDTAKELYDLIQLVKEETGHDKINIMPISLGGTIANSLFEFYPQVYDDLNKVIYIVPALDGSAIIGDVYGGKLSTSDEMLYNKLFVQLVGGYTGYLLNVVIRILPKQVVIDMLEKAVGALRDLLLVNCTTMWGLVPGEDYETLSNKLLSDDEHAQVKRQTDLYYQAQANSKKNIMKLLDKGVKVFNIVDYNQPLYAIVPSWETCNADGVIDLDSTSMGAYSINNDVPLGDDYVQQNTHCQIPGHNHISPDGCVDASTGLLPDQTFYFYNQHHEGTGRNDVIMKLAIELLLTDNIQNVYSCPEKFPQFNVGRETKDLTKQILPQAKAVDQSTLSAENAAELQAAIDGAEAMLNETVVVYENFENAQQRLIDILVKIGVREKGKNETVTKIAVAVCKLLSDALYKYYGAKGFSD